MPTKQEHQKQIGSNEGFYKELNTLLGAKYFDWKITTLFYIIIHYADALCAENGIKQIKNHKDREKHLQNFLNRTELSLYRGLKSASQTARYEVGCLDKSAMKYWQDVYKNYYDPLRTSLQKKIP